VISLLKQFNTS